MWHEARKQEKKIRGLLVDYQRRAQRRKDYYEKIRADPTQFLQLHGRQCKIHIDPSIAIAANSPATMMSWQGNGDIMIDRFDARAHLDFIREPKKDDEDVEVLSNEERQLNYERYRILVQNEFLTISENKFLHQLYLEEKFGPVGKSDADDAKKKSTANAAIPYKYSDEDTIQTDDSKKYLDIKPKTENSDESDEESEVDFDLSIDISKIGTDQANELNSTAHGFGMTTNDFYSFLNNDLEEAENIQLARLAEEEKAMFAGRRSRRERRAFRLKALEGKALSPLSYATRKSPSYNDYDQLSSMVTSRSPTPENSGQVTYITSFGDEEPVLNDKSRINSKSKSSSKHQSKRKRNSRSKSPRGKSKSPSKGHRYRSRSQNNSPSPTRNNIALPATQKPPPVQRYYGRRGNDSSSELSISDDDIKDKSTNNTKLPLPDLSLASSSKKPVSSDSKPTPQEIMKRKMKVLLNKQYKADKKAQRERELKMEREQIEREEEIKELSLKMRRKRRQLRHPNSSSLSRSRSRSKSTSSSSSATSSNYSRYRSHRRRSRSKSRSGGRRRSRSNDRRRRSKSGDRNWTRRSEERERYRRDDRRDNDRRDDYCSRRSPERRDRKTEKRDSPVRKEIKQRETPIRKEIKSRESPVRKDVKQRDFPDRNKKEYFGQRPAAAKITYEASPKHYVPSTKVQSSLKPLVDYE